MFNTIDRVFELISERNSTLYKVCKKSGVNYTTVINAKRRNGQLAICTIERICDTLDISLSEFFREPDTEKN